MGILLLLPVVAVLRGYVLSTLWGWFIVPIFEVRALTVVPAIGLSLIAQFVTQQAHVGEDQTQQSLEKIIQLVTQSILYPIFALVFGWIVSRFM